MLAVHRNYHVYPQNLLDDTAFWSIPVSYTHLDVYKRQLYDHVLFEIY